MREVILIGVAGALGAVSRYGLSIAANRFVSESLPFGTLAVNVIGCFLIGYVMHMGLVTDVIPAAWRLALTVGFLGGLTTFSSFSYETVALLQEGAWAPAVGNIVANVVLGITATLAGLGVGRLTLGAA